VITSRPLNIFVYHLDGKVGVETYNLYLLMLKKFLNKYIEINCVPNKTFFILSGFTRQPKRNANSPDNHTSKN
jgi:hypothetical protein